MGLQRPRRSRLFVEANVPPQTFHKHDHIGQTLRLQNLPTDTTEQDIVKFFDARLNAYVSHLNFGLSQGDRSLKAPALAYNSAGVHPYIQRVGVIDSSPDSMDQRATVTFWSHSLANQAKKFSNEHFWASHGGVSKVQIDDDFLGLTTIYSSTNSWEHETTLQ